MLVFQENDQDVDFREGNARWVAKLSNGQNVYDNNRENVSTWIELHNYCYENELYIVEMYAHFRTNNAHLPPNKDGYYFSRSLLGSLLDESNTHFFLLGYEENGVIYIHKYRTPDMTLVETEERNPLDAEHQLISKNYIGIPKRKK